MDAFFSCDWGTTSFRLRYVSVAALQVLAEETSGEGIAATFNLWKQSNKSEEVRFDFYLSILKEKIKIIEQKLNVSLAGTPIIISGMASSSIGMQELPYKHIPYAANGENLVTKKINKTPGLPHELLIISGVRTEDDVLRGEETQLAGCAPFSNDEMVFIFPGTHSKHILVKGGQVVGFNTYMTGDFFDLLANKSLLSSSVEKTIANEVSMPSFRKGVNEANTNLLHSAFLVRTNQLFNKFSKQENYFYLSGLLIGQELKDLKNYNAATIFLVGTNELNAFYTTALEILFPGIIINSTSADEVTIRGQYVIYSMLWASQ